TVHDNTIHDLTGTSQNAYGIYTSNNGTSEFIYSNTIYNLTASTSSSTVGAWGIYAGGTPAFFKNTYDNTIHDLTGGTTTGIYGVCSGACGGSFYRNKIYTLKSNNSSGITYGLNLFGGTQTAYNQFISELTAPSGTLTENVYGIYAVGSTLKM